MKMRLLVADDERDMNKILTKKLVSEGYTVDSCYDGAEALDYISVVDYDGIILDIMMPKADGYEVLRQMNNMGKDAPVLLLTAKDSVADRVKGLDAGANDYLIKPFSFDELLARIRAMTRKKTVAASETLTAADLSMDTVSHTVTRGGKQIELYAREYSLLEYLLRNKGIVLSREKIESHILRFDYDGGTNLVDVYISGLRKKVDTGYTVKLIHTVRGSGYVLKEC